MIPPRKTRQIQVGPLRIGGDAPIAVQSMAATRTQDVAATRRQVELLQEAGADLVRIAIDSPKDAEALGLRAFRLHARELVPRSQLASGWTSTPWRGKRELVGHG